MKIFRHIEDQGLSMSQTVATMGNFDGIQSYEGTKLCCATLWKNRRGWVVLRPF